MRGAISMATKRTRSALGNGNQKPETRNQKETLRFERQTLRPWRRSRRAGDFRRLADSGGSKRARRHGRQAAARSRRKERAAGDAEDSDGRGRAAPRRARSAEVLSR